MTERERPPQFQSDSEDEYPMQEVRKKKKRRRQNPNGQPEPNVAFEEPPKDIQLDVDTRQSNAELRKRHTRQKSRAGQFFSKIVGNVIGLPVDRGEKNTPVPEGYELKFSSLGQGYLVKKGGPVDEAADNKAAMDEHVRMGSRVSACASRNTLAKHYGEGVYQYFDFIIYLMLTNVVLTATGLIPLIAHFVIDGWVWLESGRYHENLFTSTYSPGIRPYWFWSMVGTAVVYSLMFGPFLGWRITKRFKSIGYVDTEDRYSGSDAADVIKDRKGFAANPSHLSAWRMILSYFFFLLILAVSGSITMILVMCQVYLVIPFVGGSLLISVVLEIVNAIWKKLCYFLTRLERHFTWTSFNQHHVLKYWLWKFLNVSLVFLARWFVSAGIAINFPIWGWVQGFAPPAIDVDGCELQPMAEQFFTILLADMTVGQILDVGVPLLRLLFQRCCRGKLTGPRFETGRPEYDFAEGYLNLMYRQYIIYLGFPFFPLIGLMGLLANVIDYPIDKFILLRISRTPPQLRGSMRHYLIFFLFVTALLAMAIFPYGSGWVMYGFSIQDRCRNGTIYAGEFLSSIGLPPTTTPT